MKTESQSNLGGAQTLPKKKDKEDGSTDPHHHTCKQAPRLVAPRLVASAGHVQDPCYIQVQIHESHQATVRLAACPACSSTAETLASTCFMQLSEDKATIAARWASGRPVGNEWTWCRQVMTDCSSLPQGSNSCWLPSPPVSSACSLLLMEE